jgi:glycosyltransferase involved in cell wall biosynthesis
MTKTRSLDRTLAMVASAFSKTAPLRVAHITGSFPPATFHGGPIASTHGLCCGLVEHGATVQVLTTDANGPRRIDVPLDAPQELDGMRVRYCHSLTERPLSPDLLRRIPEQVRWSDVVHITGVYEHHTLPTLAACRALGKPVVWSPRGSLQRWERVKRQRAKAAWERACRLVMPARSALHVTAEPEARASRARMPDVASVVVPNGVFLPPTVAAERAEGERLNLMFLGRLDPIKGLDRLLEACQRAKTPWRLTIAGAGHDDLRLELEQQAARLGIEDRVQFLGDVRGDEKQRLFDEHDVLVLPSFSENFGMVVAEALGHGRPVVASTGTPWAGLVEHDCGRWVDNTPDAMARAIDDLARCDRRAMGARGRSWMEREMTWSRIAERMLGVYRALASSEPLAHALASLSAHPQQAT